MDVLQFIKDEAFELRQQFPSLVGGDQELISETSLAAYLDSVRLLMRVFDDLVLPELSDVTTRNLSAIANAGTLSTDLDKIAAVAQKQGKISDSKRLELYKKLALQLNVMEQQVLPLFREKIPTRVREELGLVAVDFRQEGRRVKIQTTVKTEFTPENHGSKSLSL